MPDVNLVLIGRVPKFVVSETNKMIIRKLAVIFTFFCIFFQAQQLSKRKKIEHRSKDNE